MRPNHTSPPKDPAEFAEFCGADDPQVCRFERMFAVGGASRRRDDRRGCASAVLAGSAVVHVTDGAPRDGKDAAREGFPSWQEYAAERARELDQALVAGAAEHAIRYQLGFAESGCLSVAVESGGSPAPHSMPTLVITHAYEGGHPITMSSPMQPPERGLAPASCGSSPATTTRRMEWKPAAFCKAAV